MIVYATDWGSTKKMAEAIAKGAESVGEIQVLLREAEQATMEEVEAVDALVLGSPVHMGSMDWRVKKFIDTICSKLWMKDKLNGRVGAVFASGGGFGNGGGGCELTMLSMLNNLVELGLIVIPLPKNTSGYSNAGLQWGPYGRSLGPNMEKVGLAEAQLEVAMHHGIHVARAAKLIKGQKIFG